MEAINYQNTSHTMLYQKYSTKQTINNEYRSLLNEYFENKKKLNFNSFDTDRAIERRDNELIKECRLPLDVLKQLVENQRLNISLLEKTHK